MEFGSILEIVLSVFGCELLFVVGGSGGGGGGGAEQGGGAGGDEGTWGTEGLGWEFFTVWRLGRGGDELEVLDGCVDLWFGIELWFALLWGMNCFNCGINWKILS